MDNMYLEQIDFNRSKLIDYPFVQEVVEISEEHVEPTWPSVKLLDILEVYYKPTFSTLGLLLNSVSVAVFVNTDLNRLAVCHYLIAIGIIDNFYLITVMIPWLSKYGINVFTSMGICQMVLYLSHFASFLTCWYMALMIMQRSSRIYSRGMKRRFESVLQAKFIILLVAIFAGVGFLHVTWTHGVVEKPLRCTVLPENESQIRMLKKVELMFALVFPWIITCAFLLVQLLKYCVCHKWLFPNSTQTKAEIEGSAVLANPVSGAVTAKWSVRTFGHVPKSTTDSTDSTMNVTCIFLAAFFLLSSLPYMIAKIRVSYINEVEDKFFQPLFKNIYLLNFVIKFFVFFSSVHEFRRGIAVAFGGLTGHELKKEIALQSVCFPRVCNKTRMIDTTDL